MIVFFCDQLRPELLKEIVERAWNKAPIGIVFGTASHGKCFTRPGLTIGEDSAIVAPETVVDDALGDAIEDLILVS